MSKEELCSQYMQRYREYIEKHKAVDRLKESIKTIQDEGKHRSDSLKTEKENELQSIYSKRDKAQRDLNSVIKDGTNSTVARDYSAAELQKISQLKNEIRNLESTQANELSNLRKQKKQQLDTLEKDRKQCQTRLENLQKQQAAPVGQFDEAKLREALTMDKERKLAKMAKEYDDKIANDESQLLGLDQATADRLKAECAYIENDIGLMDLYQSLNGKLETNELPQALTAALEEPAADAAERLHLKRSQEIAALAHRAFALDDLLKYAPKWVEVAFSVILPILIGVGLFLAIKGSFYSLFASVASAVTGFLFAMLVGLVIFLVLFGIISKLSSTVFGAIGGTIGGLLGIWIMKRMGVRAPMGVTSAVAMILKILICIVVVVALLIITHQDAVVGAFTKLIMKIPPLKNMALAKQSQELEGQIDDYYVLLRYRPILEYISERDRKAKFEQLTNEVEWLRGEKETNLAELAENCDQEQERTVEQERRAAEDKRERYEQNQRELFQAQDACMMELSGYDEKFRKASADSDAWIAGYKQDFDRKLDAKKQKLKELQESLSAGTNALQTQLMNEILHYKELAETTEADYDRKIASAQTETAEDIRKVQAEIEQKNREFAEDLEAMRKLFKDITSKTVSFEESQGVVSDYLYLYNEANPSEPKKLTCLKHNKKPIVFLYDLDNSTNVASDLYNFMYAVLSGLYMINNRETFDLTITDPVSKARKFEPNKSFLQIKNDVKELSISIQDSMRKASEKGGGMAIDEYNRKMHAEEEDKVNYLKYQIVEFIVPEEAAAQNTNFFDSDLWGTLGDGCENGFLPIFYINYSDWKNTFDKDEKLNSKFITLLKRGIGDDGNVYKIDVNDITIQKI